MNRSRGVITADRAYNMSRESARGSRITEDRIMHTVETVIESSARQGRQFAFYTVPLYQFGLPIYKASEVVKHVGRRLTHRGFRVKQPQDEQAEERVAHDGFHVAVRDVGQAQCREDGARVLGQHAASSVRHGTGLLRAAERPDPRPRGGLLWRGERPAGMGESEGCHECAYYYCGD
eukprot:jgi/Mesvir1/17092/Mv05662-RA.1